MNPGMYLASVPRSTMGVRVPSRKDWTTMRALYQTIPARAPGQGEQDMLAVGQHFRSVDLLIAVPLHQRLGNTAGFRDLKDAFVALSEDDAARPPAHTGRRVGLA